MVLVVAHLLRPSEAEIEEAARELVPPGAELGDVTGIGGDNFLNPPFYIRVEFFSAAPSHEPVVAAGEAIATSNGWLVIGEEVAPNGTTRISRRSGMAARVLVFHKVVEGVILVERDGNAQLRRQITWGGVGTVAGLALAIAVFHHRKCPPRAEPL